MSPPVLCDPDNGILRILLNRPERRNALSLEMLDALNEVLIAVLSEPSTRVVLLSSSGPAFSAGMDLNLVSLVDPDVAGRFAASLANVYRNLLRLPFPLLCAVDGPVIGGAVGLALAADLIWAGPGTAFCFPETKIGLVPALVSVVARRRLSTGHLAALAISGLAVSGPEALRLGLADFLAVDSAAAEAEVFARTLIRENSGEAISRTKNFLAVRDLADLDSELVRATCEFSKMVVTAAARRRLAAFQEKRGLAWDDASEVDE